MRSFHYNIFNSIATRDSKRLVSSLSFIKLFYSKDDKLLDIKINIVQKEKDLELQVRSNGFTFTEEHLNYLQFQFHDFVFCQNVEMNVQGKMYSIFTDVKSLDFKFVFLRDSIDSDPILKFNLPHAAYSFSPSEFVKDLNDFIDFSDALYLRKIQVSVSYLATTLSVFPSKRNCSKIFSVIDNNLGFIAYFSVKASGKQKSRSNEVFLTLGNGDLLPVSSLLAKKWLQTTNKYSVNLDLKVTFYPLVGRYEGFNWFSNFASLPILEIVNNLIVSKQLEEELIDLSKEIRRIDFESSIQRLQERRINIYKRKGIYYKDEFLFVEPKSEIETVCVFTMLNSRGVLGDLGISINLIEYTPKIGIDSIADFGIKDYLAFSEKRFLEFEYNLYNFISHGHRPQECDFIVCYTYSQEDFDGSEPVSVELLNPSFPYLLNLVFNREYNDFLMADKRIPVIVLTLLPNVNVKEIK